MTLAQPLSSSAATVAVPLPPDTARSPAPPRPAILLRGVSWETYRALRDAAENQRLRMTFDRGALEIMSPSRQHAKISTFLAALVSEWAVRQAVEVEFGGDTTFRREDLARGLEPDQCYWIARQAMVRGKDEIDLAVDPPPDLALEIEVTRSALGKLPIYQALQVPEIWQWRAETLQVLVLQPTGEYVAQAESLALPGFPIRLAEELLRRRGEASDTALLRLFRQALA